MLRDKLEELFTEVCKFQVMPVSSMGERMALLHGELTPEVLRERDEADSLKLEVATVGKCDMLIHFYFPTLRSVWQEGEKRKVKADFLVATRASSVQVRCSRRGVTPTAMWKLPSPALRKD